MFGSSIITALTLWAPMMVLAQATGAGLATEPEGQSIEIVGTRARLAVPYQRAHEVLKRVHAASGDQVEVYFQAVTNRGTGNAGRDLSLLRIWLEADERSRRLPVDEAGRFAVPLLSDDRAATAELFSNAGKGELSIRLHLRPAMRAADFSLERAISLAASARKVRSELVPWYARLFVPTIYGLGVCFRDLSQARSALGVQPEGVDFPIVQAKNDRDQTLHCVGIDERTYPNAKLNVSAATELLFITERMPLNTTTLSIPNPD